jgi:low density lipoprotein receptor-related protein 5/6
MFWSNEVNPPRIERATLDGKSITTIISTNLGKLGALALDTELGYLYWTDVELHRIEFSDLHGQNRKVLVNTQILNPVGITVYGHFLYWIDKDQQLIERVRKTTGRNRQHVQGRVSHISDIHSVEALTLDSIQTHRCVPNNGGCSHICVSKKDGTTKCSCPVNLVLSSDGVTCTEPPTCAPDMFTCQSGSIDCIPMVWRCDGLAECEDSSDEINCPECLNGQFRCKNGQCIDMKYKCDSSPQCTDGSDEELCCAADEFQCKNYQCVKKQDHCDGIYDCKDGTDETMCCAQRQFQCHNYECISASKRCDSFKDCNDGTDELLCPSVVASPHQNTHTNPAPYVVAVVVALVVIIVVIVLFVYTYRKKTSYEHAGDIIMTKPLNPLSGQSTPPHILTMSRGKSHTTSLSVSTAPTGPSNYDRNHVTGASSSSSSMTRYPQETLNPPPSPVTDRSQCADLYYSSNSPSTVRSYRPYKHRHIPPPPTTPCSTDVCDDSEPYQSKKYYRSLADFYDSDPYPPPPTPRSHYLSDEISCPPSPSTERSFFNPYPPPPSPVGTSDC